MPDAAEILILLVLTGAVATVVALPFLRHAAEPHAGDAREDAALRREIAYEALRDLEADRVAGSLGESQYLAQREEAEERAAAALAALEAEPPVDEASAAAERAHPKRGARAALVIGAAVIGLVLVGFVGPGAPLANRTVVNQELAAAIEREQERQAEIARLIERLADDPRDAEAYSDLADAYLAGSSSDDLFLAATALIALIALEPRNRTAYTRLITAYIRAGDYDNAAAATESFERLAPGSADLAFFEGIIALRRDGDEAAAIEAFDRFLELSPDDPRAGMVRTLRADAVGQLSGGSSE